MSTAAEPPKPVTMPIETPSTNGNYSEMTTHPLLINNTPHKSPSSFPVHSPSDTTHLHNFSSASPSCTSDALSSASTAFPAWAALPPPTKRDIFLQAAFILKSRLPSLQATMTRETGASPSWAAFDTNLAIQILLDVSGRLSSLTGSIPTPSDPGTSALVYKEPYGVVLAIAPWNAPHILGMRSIIYPLAAGNTVIFKAHELSPLTHTALVTALHDAGLPPGVLTLLAHAPAHAAEVTRQLIEDPRIKKVNFTGSTNVGRVIAEMAGRCLKPVVLELGGKAPAIVWRDADVGLAARECAVGAFMHGGQVCMSTERIIVHEDIAEDFQAAFKKAIAELGFDGKGCLINGASVLKNQHLVRDAVSKGATLIHGSLPSSSSSSDNQDQNQDQDHGAHMSPLVIKNPPQTSSIYSTESFGPTVSLYTISSESEALSLANDTDYGLSAAIFTSDLRRGLRMARGVESGAVHINGMTVHDETALPHGGMKDSGYGRFGAAGLEEWVRTKTVTFKN